MTGFLNFLFLYKKKLTLVIVLFELFPLLMIMPIAFDILYRFLIPRKQSLIKILFAICACILGTHIDSNKAIMVICLIDMESCFHK